MKDFKGKAIYNPSGKAGEYSYWACNFYVGCSNGCEYCYCKKGILAGAMGQDKPQLKKCFKDEAEALKIFEDELVQNYHELKQHGIFFSFTTDPLLPETEMLTWWAAGYAVSQGIPVKILTKCTEWVEEFLTVDMTGSKEKQMYAFGFTLTGHDELEKGAATNSDRIRAMKVLSMEGFKTWASIEPIIDFESSYNMIVQTVGICDLYKIGLMSGKKYDKDEARWFTTKCMASIRCNHSKAYFKDSIVSAIGASREDMKQWQWGSCLVDRNYNMFNDNAKP
ncbi:radical SAM protein [bacterium]|jgi:DNA repair photolyase|nr:radical SAM protein [bacterium]